MLFELNNDILIGGSKLISIILNTTSIEEEITLSEEIELARKMLLLRNDVSLVLCSNDKGKILNI